MNEVSAKKFMSMCTVRIESVKQDGSIGVGTGFFLDTEKLDDKYIPLVITNKHVIADSVEIRFLFTIAKIDNETITSTRLETVRIVGDQIIAMIRLHPNPLIDLCAVGIGRFHQHYKSSGEDILRAPIEKDMLADKQLLDSLEPAEDIVMVGYPTGLFDATNNRPIVRKGTTATSPGIDFNGMKQFAIDCACFPGSSGSPIFLFNEGFHADNKNKIIMGQTRLKLIGVLFAGPQFDVHGRMVTLPIPTDSRELPSLKLMINIGYCVPSTELEWFYNDAASIHNGLS